MLDLLWLIPVLPFAGFLTLVFCGRRLPAGAIAAVGSGCVGLSMVASLLILADFIGAPPPGLSYSQTLWTWLQIGGFAPVLGFYLDGLSLVMVVVITFVGFLILLYSTRFMEVNEDYSRFFAYMNLFVGSMLLLVLADNLLFLYLGWEGVGLCSYLLIGFWYRESENGKAAMKAFLVTRIGDTSLVVGFFILFMSLGTLQIQDLVQKAGNLWVPGSSVATAAAALLLGGAVGKSAQLPLQTWLPDAMAGPTPVSALIHAATMVTAGVYLIARMHLLFILAPYVQFIVALIGLVTLLVAGASALVQRDIKKILAYSTMSQVGYMFLALGVGAWSAAISHFVTHAFFKALLFLSAGVVIQALDNEHDIFKMGGLRKTFPIAFWTFVSGAVSLSAFPFVTAGFYSKEMILSLAWSSTKGGAWLWTAGIVGALLTSIYAFRMVFVAFFGNGGPVRMRPAVAMKAPLVILSILSIVGGLLILPSGALAIFGNLLHAALPGDRLIPAASSSHAVLKTVASLVGPVGCFVAGFLYLARPSWVAVLADNGFSAIVGRFWFVGWGFDWLYKGLLVNPFMWIARINKDDVIDLFYRLCAFATALGARALVATQSGKVRWYVMGMALGVAVYIAIAVFL